jgi:pyruvate/2-oxoglutarate dehydrogenase complex dihydrolipoamide acyltransferase (E2) component
MFLDMRLTTINPNMSSGTIECCYVELGSPIKAGQKLFDLRVDLSSGFSQYCPPISYFRVVAREAGWLRKLLVKPGDTLNVGDLLAIFSTSSDESEDNTPERPLRVTTAGIAHHAAMWSASDQ